MIEMPILSDEQITEHQLPDGDYDITGLLQHQLKEDLRWFVEWGEEQCPNKAHYPFYKMNTQRSACPDCWQELLQQLDILT